MSAFRTFLEQRKPTKSNLALSITTEDLESELLKRQQAELRFPLEAFHDRLAPFTSHLVNVYDLPPAYVGSMLLSAFSTATGTAAAVSMNGEDRILLCVWLCIVGDSSAGKSTVQNEIFKALVAIQDDYDEEWRQTTHNIDGMKRLAMRMRQVIFRDIHIATLVRSVLTDNPKGLIKDADEILEWINGMDSLSKKEGTDAQFWLSTWDGRSYSAVRSGKDKYSVKNPFVNVVGGIQTKIVGRLFEKNRDITGFIFRVLFALPQESRIARPDYDSPVPKDARYVLDRTLERMHTCMPQDPDTDIDWKRIHMTPAAKKAWKDWEYELAGKINTLKDNRDVHMGIYGKIKAYALRFAGLLALSDWFCDDHGRETSIPSEFLISEACMKRALLLGDYFYKSASLTFEIVQGVTHAPIEVVQISSMIRNGYSYEMIAKRYYDGKKTKDQVRYLVKEMTKRYPIHFGVKRG
jgi:hypothetical protein